MSKVDILEVKKTILEDNDADAEVLRGELKEQKLCYLNLMSSPGSGKTTTLLSLLKAINHRIEVGVMEADIDSDVDAKTIADAGYKSIQLHTGGMCHLDAEMSRQGMRGLGCDDLDLVILENVGNLVCPAEFDTGAVLNVVILSITEGDDKPLKYPLVFEQCDAVIINKIDALPVFDFDFDKARANIALRNDHATVFPISAKTTEGVDKLADWIVEKVQECQGK
jgi:hydrogenase nickel incorporation protein HypB